MLKKISYFILAGALLSCGNTNEKKNSDSTVKTENVTNENSLTEAEKAEGWELLFDGKSLSQWHKYGNQPVGEAWKVADGTFYLDTLEKDGWRIKGGGDIVTNKEFENFHLKLEWKISEGGNSGIIFFVQEDTAKYEYTFETGPEMQILDNDKHGDGKIIKHRAGDLYDLISCNKETVKAVGEWNQVEIKHVNGQLDFFLNGENVVSTKVGDENWNQLIAKSKFKDWEGFAKNTKGKIALQDHGNLVWFKNVKIKTL